jgi:Na+-transporting NADH:ubiquinone oxidoreductase subunit NqrC
MGIFEIKKELKKFDKDKLIEIIADLYKKDKTVKDYFDFFINPNEKLIFSKYKDKIFEAFYPKRGNNLKLNDAKKAITDLKRLEVSVELITDHMLFMWSVG